MIKLVIDTMGGDNGSEATIGGIQRFLSEVSDAEVVAVGDEKELEPLKDKVKIIHSKDVIPMECSVLQAMRSKESSMHMAVQAVLSENADGIISCGSTGAFLSLSTLILKKMDGILRPALVTPFPTKIEGKQCVLLDVGASSENTEDELVQFAEMGRAYYSANYGKKDPNFYLISNGTEEGKGTPLYQRAYAKMKGMDGFSGYIEGRYVLSGDADVVVFDGFTGNIFLKTAEGVAKMMSGMIKEAFMSSASSKVGYLFSKKGFKKMRDKMDYKKVGGALLLGLNKIVVKAHGNSDSNSFYYSIMIAYKLAKNGVVNKIKENLAQ